MPSKKSKITVYKLRRYFISGLLVWVPIWITVIVLSFLISLLDRTIILLPDRYHIAGLGAILSLLIILLTGLLVGNYIGNYVISLWDLFISHIPIVNTIHTGVKDVMKTLVQPEGNSFKKVFLVEFPRKKMWTIAFQTGDCTSEIETALNNNLISLFIPTTPNITSGFLVMVAKDEVVELDIPIEQALKFVITLGVVKTEEKTIIQKYNDMP